MGDQAAAALARVLAGKPSLETKRRAEQLLARALGQVHNPERLRQLRALEALERMDTGDAQRLIKALAGGAPDAGLTRDARRALARSPARSEVYQRALSPRGN
jgi:hypothetical protein